jgi:hypothetical protein
MSRGELGCFALTEEGAGVLSGLVVDTIARWTPSGYELSTPNERARKTWISQGGLRASPLRCADWRPCARACARAQGW